MQGICSFNRGTCEISPLQRVSWPAKLHSSSKSEQGSNRDRTGNDQGNALPYSEVLGSLQAVAVIEIEPHSDNACGLNGSMQHWLAALSMLESEIPKSFAAVADLIAMLLRPVPLESGRTGQSF